MLCWATFSRQTLWKVAGRNAMDRADVVTFSSGTFPNDLKTARVVPLHKKSSKTNVGNYRPVSILSTLSNVVERLFLNQLEGYLLEHKLLYELQSGFRKAHSTDTCLIHPFDHIKQESEKGNYTGMVMLDLQKAFDTVEHDILLMKLKRMGLNDVAVNWFRSYLTNRTQVCNVGDVLSEAKEISCGVPQGAILGPLLFLIYLNDMPDTVK